MKILIIIPYFGKWPAWMDYFLQSCSYNPSIHWLLYSNCEEPIDCPDNILFKSKTLNDFNILASEKLMLKINIYNPYKICDLRPAFGHIFSDYLEDYDLWGYADLDLIFGNIKSFLPDDLLEKHNIISVREHYLAGHFALYKNAPDINSLYTKSKFYMKIFQDSGRHYAFDERSNFLGKKLPRRPGGVENWRNFFYRISLIQKALVRLKPALWKTEYPDMTTIVKKSAESGEIKMYHKDLVRSDIWFKKHNFKRWEIVWKDGRIIDMLNGKEFLHFHFIRSKHQKNFKIETYKSVNEFMIRPEGIMQIKDNC